MTTVLNHSGYITQIDNVNSKINLIIPEGETTLDLLAIGGLKGNVFLKGTDTIKKFYQKSFTVTIDMSNPNEKIKEFAQDGSSVEYSFAYVTEKLSISGLKISASTFTTPVITGKDYTFTVDPNLLSAKGNKFAFDFATDRFSNVSALYNSGTKVPLTSGKTEVDVTAPFKIVVSNGYISDTLNISVNTF
ncbi:MAG: hypothetical protein IPO21_14110 [Bacteroidales bacterium]|nr:hypothetical protein [Bacteroidales bacterium]